jgi:hypothetical protein
MKGPKRGERCFVEQSNYEIRFTGSRKNEKLSSKKTSPKNKEN